MKNLKKILALVLAFACAFTMFAGAAFTDQADINADNADAVELLTTLNIISGYPDGSFDPEGTVDRAEMAKMIYTIRNGGNDDASAHVDNTTSFTDINGHWAEGYIKYLQNTGIVAGKSATTFDPDSPVTTTEAMKMALALAGYDEKNAELTGPNWSKNTLTLATTIGLTDNVSSAMNAGCTRQDAAQILANVLEATAVRYSAIVENFVNDSKTGLSYGGDPITVGYKWMDLTVYVGRMVSSGDLNIDGAANAGKDRFSVVVDTVNGVDATSWTWDDWSNNWVSRTRTLTVKDGQDHTDLVGMEVKVLTGDKADEVYGVYATATSKVVETTMDKVDVENDLDLTVDEVTYDAKDANVYVDLDTEAYNVADVFTSNGQAVADTVKMIDWDDDGDYETILVNTVSVSKVNYVSSSSITLSAVGASNKDRNIGDKLENSTVIDFDGNNIAEGIAKGDFAVVTINDYDDSWNVAVATVVEGTVNGVIQDERKVRVDGTWYTLANDKTGAKSDDTDLYTVQNSVKEFVNKDAVTLYVVGDIAYYAEATKGNDINRSVLMVYDVQDDKDQWGDKNQIKVIFPTGDKKTVTLADDSAVTIDGDIEVKVGQMYYYMTNNDDEYLLTVLGTDANQEDAGYENVVTDNDGIDGEDSFGKRTIADEAIVFALVGGDDAKVYSGKTIKDAKLTGAATEVKHDQLGQALQETDNGFTYTRMMNIDIAKDTIDTTTAYGYLVTDATYSYNSELGQYVMEYSYWNGEELVDKIEITSSNKKDQMHKHTIIAFAEDGEYIKDVKPADVTYAALVGYSNGSVSLNNEYGIPKENTVADVDADTITFYVDSNATSAEKIGQKGEGWDYVAPIRNGESLINVAYILDNDDKDVKFIVIDVDGQLAGHDTVDTDIDDGDDGETGEVETLPNTSDMAVTVSGGMGAARLVDNQLYVQFNATGITQAQTKTVSGTLTITENGTGKISYVDFKDLAITKGTQASEVLKMAYTPASTTTSLTISPVINVDEYYVAYQIGGKDVTTDMVAAGATEYVKNEANAAINFTVKKPTGVSDFTIANNTSVNVDTTNFAKADQKADVAITSKLTAAGVAPVVKLTVTNNKYEVAANVRSGAYSKENGVLAVDIADTELSSTGGNVALTVVTTKDLVGTDNRIVVDYTIDGVAQTQVVENGAAKNTFSIDLATGALTKGITLEVTSIKVQAKFNAITATISQAGTLSKDGALKVMNGEKEVTTSDWIDVGTKLQLVATVSTNSSGSATLTPNSSTGLNTDTKTVAKDKTNEQVTWDYTMALGVTSLTAAVTAS